MCPAVMSGCTSTNTLLAVRASGMTALDITGEEVSVTAPIFIFIFIFGDVVLLRAKIASTTAGKGSRVKVRVSNLRAKVRVPVLLAGKGSRANVCGQRFDKGSRAGKACGQSSAETCSGQPANCPLHHRLLLQRLQTRLQHGTGHGPAHALRRRLAPRRVDRRPAARNHRNDQAQAPAPGVDVVLVERQDAGAALLAGGQAQGRASLRRGIQVRRHSARRLNVPARQHRTSSVVA